MALIRTLKNFWILIVLILASNCLSAEWRILQPDTKQYCQSRSINSTVVVSKVGSIYWAIRSCDAREKGLRVVQYDGVSWAKLPSPFNQNLKVWTYDVAVDANDVLYLAVRAGNWDDGTMVFKWDGLSWTRVGTNLVGAQDQHHLIMDIVFDANNNPILVVQENSRSLFLDLSIYKLVNNTWTLIGDQSFNNNRIHRLQAIYMNKSNELLINANLHDGNKYHHYVLSFKELTKKFTHIFEYDTGNGDEVAIALDRNGDGRLVTYNVARTITSTFTYKNGAFVLDKKVNQGSGTYLFNGIAFDTANTMYIEQYRSGAALLTINSDKNEIFTSGLGYIQYGKGDISAHPNGTFIMSAFHGKDHDAMIVEFDPLLLGTGVFQTKNKIEIYPNPTKGNLVISSSQNMLGRTVRIQTINGTIVYQEELDREQMNLDVSFWESGIYVIEIDQFRQKLVVN